MAEEAEAGVPGKAAPRGGGQVVRSAEVRLVARHRPHGTTMRNGYHKEQTVEAGSEAGGLATKTAKEQQALLAQAVADEARRGWRVESKTESQAVMLKERRSIYLLHLLSIIFTSPQAATTGSEKAQGHNDRRVRPRGHTEVERETRLDHASLETASVR